jgi:hypothetical protein
LRQGCSHTSNLSHALVLCKSQPVNVKLYFSFVRPPTSSRRKHLDGSLHGCSGRRYDVSDVSHGGPLGRHVGRAHNAGPVRPRYRARAEHRGGPRARAPSP